MARRIGAKKVHKYSAEFKLKAVKLSQIDGVQVQDVADALEIHPFMLSRWRKEAREGRIRARVAVARAAGSAGARRGPRALDRGMGADLSKDVRVRVAEAGDTADIARLAGELGYPVDPQQMQGRLSTLLKSPAHFIAVAEQGNAPVLGWVHVEHRCILEYGERAEIVGLVVSAAARRTGVATAMILSAERWAADRGLREMTVRSNVLRTGSHPFYAAMGYMRQKTQHSYTKVLGAHAAAV